MVGGLQGERPRILRQCGPSACLGTLPSTLPALRSSLSVCWGPPAQGGPHQRLPGMVPSVPPTPPRLLPQSGLPSHQLSPDACLSLRHSFQGLSSFFAGFDLPLRHFLEWPLDVCPCPDGIQMHTSLLLPGSSRSAPQPGEINTDPHLTPTSLRPWLCFPGLRSGSG